MFDAKYWADVIWDIWQKVLSLGAASPDGMFANQEIMDGINMGIDAIAAGVKPIASIILSLFCVLELHKWFTRAENTGLNGGSMVRLEMLAISLIKIGVAVFFIQHIDVIMKGVVELGEMLNRTVESAVFGNPPMVPVDVTKEQLTRHLESLDLNFWNGLTAWMELLPLNIILWLCDVAVRIIVTVRIIKIMVMTALAPIPFATFVHAEFSQIGKNYLKSFASVVLQGTVIMVVIRIFSLIMRGITFHLDNNIMAMVGSFVIYSVLLTVSVVGSSMMAKRLTNAM